MVLWSTAGVFAVVGVILVCVDMDLQSSPPVVPDAGPTVGREPEKPPSGQEAFNALVSGMGEGLDAMDAGAVKRSIDAAWDQILLIDPDTPASEQSELYNLSVFRASGYVRCAVLVNRDPSLCETLDGLLSEETRKCRAVTALWVIVADEVMRQGRDCSEVVDSQVWSFENLEDHGSAFCGAISNGKPDQCPAEFDGTPGSPLCTVAAARGAPDACRSEEHRPPWWQECCEEFGRRFAAFVDPAASPGTSPELGAISGDAQGCLRALRAGLLADVGSLFGLTGAEGSYGNGECRPVIPWQ
jgi:hypothetical protein